MFVEIFSGTKTTKKIVWIRGIRELHYLIDKLEEFELVSWPQKYGKWQMVCARFDIRVKVKEDDDYSIENSLQDCMDEFDVGEHDQMEDYRDALANDLQISSRLP